MIKILIGIGIGMLISTVLIVGDLEQTTSNLLSLAEKIKDTYNIWSPEVIKIVNAQK